MPRALPCWSQSTRWCCLLDDGPDLPMTPAPSDLPAPILDVLLRRAPLDVLLLDRRLICRYAAPVDDAFLGQPREALIDRPITEIFPPAADELRPILEHTVRQTSRWRTPLYRFSHPVDGVMTEYHWTIQVQSLTIGSFWGVLIVLGDAREFRDAAEERDRLRAECDRLYHHEVERRDALQNLRARLRSLLAPLSGYLQVLARRPYVLGGQSPATVIERRVLPQVDALVSVIDQLSADAATTSPPPATR